MEIRLRLTQRRSAIGRHASQKKTLEALGIRRLHHSVIHKDTPQIRGMINRVSHLIQVERLDADSE